MSSKIISIRAGLALVGLELDARRDVCIEVENGVIASIKSFESCSADSLGGRSLLALPQPGNAHAHSADHAFPEYGLELELDDLVAPPHGLKHRLLASAPPDRLREAITEFYKLAWRLGVGLLIDFREGGGEGCRLADEARKKIRGLDVLILGRPGPGWPEYCDGLGLASPLGYSIEELRRLVELKRPAMTHVAETLKARAGGDLELSLSAGFNAIVHGTHLSRVDLEALREKKIPLIMCPRSNIWHAVGIPPIAEALSVGVELALGTDNAAWSPPDVWEELRIALNIARLQGAKRDNAPRELLKAILVNPYKIIEKTPPLIEEGYPGKLVLAYIEGYGVLEAHNVYAAIAKRVGGHNIIARLDEDVISWLRL